MLCTEVYGSFLLFINNYGAAIFIDELFSIVSLFDFIDDRLRKIVQWLYTFYFLNDLTSADEIQ